MSGAREKKTLALFAAILLFGFSCICAYVYFGHNWNFAVSQWDDTFGDMESYTVLLYEGTIEPKEGEDKGFELTLDGSAIPQPNNRNTAQNQNAAAPGNQNAPAPGNQAAPGATAAQPSNTPAQPNGNIAAVTTPEVPIGEQVNPEEVEKAPSLGYRIARRLSRIFNLNTETSASEEETEEVKVDPIVTEDVDVSSIDKAAEAYGQKNAIPFVLDTADPKRYEQGAVLERGGKRIAVLGVHSVQSILSIQEKVDYLKSMNVDMVVAMVDEVPRLAGVTGIDVVIRCNAAEPLDWDYNANGRYLTMAPAVGSVAATIISPSNIVVTKVL